MRVLFFNALLLGVVIYAFLYGRRPEKIGALIMLLGAVLTRIGAVVFTWRFAHVEWGALAVDIGGLAALFFLAVRTDRSWTLWLAALQLTTTLGHLARAIDPEMLPNGYAFLLVAWSYPMLLTIALGTRTQQKKRRAAVQAAGSASRLKH